MANFKKRFVKCNGEYHLLTLADVEYFKIHSKWPDNYSEIDWEEEMSKGNLSTITKFLGTKPDLEQAKKIAILAGSLDVPIIKIKVQDKDYPTVNYYPKYWLEEVLNKEIRRKINPQSNEP